MRVHVLPCCCKSEPSLNFRKHDRENGNPAKSPSPLSVLLPLGHKRWMDFPFSSILDGCTLPQRRQGHREQGGRRGFMCQPETISPSTYTKIRTVFLKHILGAFNNSSCNGLCSISPLFKLNICWMPFLLLLSCIRQFLSFLPLFLLPVCVCMPMP